MVKWLINLGLGLTPFVIWHGMNTRQPKEIASLVVALAIGLAAIYQGELRRFKNYWFLLLLGFLIVSIFQSPEMSEFILGRLHDTTQITMFPMRGEHFNRFYAFKPLAYALVYSLMLIAVASQKFRVDDVHRMLTIMVLAGLAMSLYVFIQFFKLDQFFSQIPKSLNPDVLALKTPLIVGTLGHSTVVSPFILMCIPIALCKRRFLWAGLMCLAIVATESHLAIGAMVLTIIIYLCMRWPPVILAVILVTLMIAPFSAKQYEKFKTLDADVKNEGIFDTSGRTAAWKVILQDFTTPPEPGSNKRYTMTGFGLGAFTFTHSCRFNNRWFQAHNEYLELLYNIGIGGVFLFLVSIFFMVKNVCIKLSYHASHKFKPEILALLASFIGISICATGTFVWQIAPILFYTIVIVGLLSNEQLLQEMT